MDWIISYKEYSLVKELIVRYEDHLTINALKGFYFCFKREVLTPREPEEISWSEGTPSVIIDHDKRVAIITFISRVEPTEEVKGEIEKIAKDFLRLKTSEELAAAREETYKKTEGYHIRQQILGFEKKKEQKEKIPTSSDEIKIKNVYWQIYKSQPFSLKKIHESFILLLDYAITDFFYSKYPLKDGDYYSIEIKSHQERKYQALASVKKIRIEELSKEDKKRIYIPGLGDFPLFCHGKVVMIDSNDTVIKNPGIELYEQLYNFLRLSFDTKNIVVNH